MTHNCSVSIMTAFGAFPSVQRHVGDVLGLSKFVVTTRSNGNNVVLFSYLFNGLSLSIIEDLANKFVCLSFVGICPLLTFALNSYLWPVFIVRIVRLE